jgi:hypothetical protein
VGFKFQHNIEIFDCPGVIANLGARLAHPDVMVDVHLCPGSKIQHHEKQENGSFHAFFL